MLGSSPPLNDTTQQQQQHSNSPASNSIPEFVKKLFGMLEDNTYPQIFSWGTEGDTFVVKDPNEFARHILPKHFKHSNFASFVRQLNKYDFHKLRMPEDGQRIYGDQAWEFQHPNFKYNRRELLEDIKRKPTGKAAQANNQSATNSSAATTVSTSSSSNVVEEELKTIAANLQKEINGLKETQKKMTDKVKSFDKKYNVVLDNIQGFKKNMEEQDTLMREIMSYVSKQSNFPVEQDLENIINTYNNVTNTGEAQLEKLSEVVVNGASASVATTPADNVIQQQQQQIQQQQQQQQIQQQQQQQQIQQQQQQMQEQQMQEQQQLNNNTSMIPVINASAPLSRKRKRIQPGWSVPPRVLLVDDDSIFRRLSTRLLQIAGCTIDVAVDGMEAVRKLGTGKYDLVLMDIMMPKLDGMSATRNIRQYDTWTPIISMTSNTTDQDIQQYFLSGMTDVLPKPLNQGTLGNLLERYCAHLVVQRQQQQQLQLLQQNYSLNGSLIDLNRMTPQLTLIEDNNNEEKGKGKGLVEYSTNNNNSSSSSSSNFNNNNNTTTSTNNNQIMYSTASSSSIIPQLQQVQQPLPQLLNQQQQQQQWYLYVNQKRSKIEEENSIQ